MFETLVDFLRGCPKLQALQVNFLGQNPGAVSVYTNPCDPILYRYTDGDSLRQISFTICSRELMDPNNQELPESFFEAIGDWLETHLPVLQEGKTAQRFEVTASAALAEQGYTHVRYTMDCRLIYYQKGE